MGSLQEQLLKAGIVDENSLKKARADKRKTKRKPKPKVRKAASAKQPSVQILSDTSNPVEFARLEKLERDKRLNRKKQKDQERRELAAQIRQLVESGKLDRENAEMPYQFMDGKKIKKLFVTAAQQQQLIKGKLGIVKHNGSYELVPDEVAQKIHDRDASRVLGKSTQTESTPAADDPYADYAVPDDLIW